MLRYLAVGMGAISQFRALGGSIGLSICTNLLNSRVSTMLSPMLSANQLLALRSSTDNIGDIPDGLQDLVREAYASGYRLQWQAMIAFAAGAFLATFMIIEKKPRWQR